VSKVKSGAQRPKPPLSKESPLTDFVDRFITAPGFGECTQLCDVVMLDHVCELIPEAFHVLRNGHASEFPATLRSNLYEPLFRYLKELERDRLALVADWQGDLLKRLDVADTEAVKRDAKRRAAGGMVMIEQEATLHFVDQLDELAVQFEQGPWEEEDADQATHAVRYVWYRWIASISCARIHYDAPRKKAIGQRNGLKANVDGTAGRKKATDDAAILRKLKELEASSGKRAAVQETADYFGCSRTKVAQLRQARDANDTNPAG
jgi:hypothetical protein